jgi:hypothetical protein
MEVNGVLKNPGDYVNKLLNNRIASDSHTDDVYSNIL